MAAPQPEAPQLMSPMVFSGDANASPRPPMPHNANNGPGPLIQGPPPMQGPPIQAPPIHVPPQVLPPPVNGVPVPVQAHGPQITPLTQAQLLQVIFEKSVFVL